MLVAERLSFSYGRREVLRDVSLRLRPGCVLALLGPNGCGKSTLLRLLLGLLRPEGGRVLLEGRSLAGLSAADIARRLAYVPQQTSALFAYTAAEIVAMGRTFRHPLGIFVGRRDREIAMAALDRLGAGALGGRIFSSLSGGERQLVILARALAQETPILLMDEPVTGLDYGHQLQLLELVAELARTENKTVLVTTHAPEHALAVADEAILLKAGRIVRQGDPSAVLGPENLAELYEVAPSRLQGFQARCRLPGSAALDSYVA